MLRWTGWSWRVLLRPVLGNRRQYVETGQSGIFA